MDKSALVVAIVAICMVTVALPVMVLATNDDNNDPPFFLDFDLSAVKDSEDFKTITEVIEAYIKEQTGAPVEIDGKHIGTNTTEGLDGILSAAAIKTITDNLAASGLTDVGFKCLQDASGILSPSLMDCHWFVLYYTE